jgi:hypothetical protein
MDRCSLLRTPVRYSQTAVRYSQTAVRDLRTPVRLFGCSLRDKPLITSHLAKNWHSRWGERPREPDEEGLTRLARTLAPPNMPLRRGWNFVWGVVLQICRAQILESIPRHWHFVTRFSIGQFAWMILDYERFVV